MSQSLIEQLHEDLPGVDDAALADVVRIVRGDKASRSMEQLAIALLSSNVSVGNILTSLLRCEWHCMQETMSNISSDTLQGQLRIFNDNIEHFNALQAAVISAADQRWHKMLNGERKFRVVAECRVEWLASKKVHLHNFFREVPVSARANILSVEKSCFWIEISQEVSRVFSVAGDKRSALIISPDNSYNLIAEIKGGEEGRACLVIRDVVQAFREQRADVRLQPDEHVTVKVVNRGREFSAEMVDISCSGLGLRFAEKPEIDSSEAFVCSWQLGEEEMQISGVIRWMKQEDHFFRIGIRLETDQVRRSNIYRYLFLQQKSIAERLSAVPLLKFYGSRHE